MLDPTKLQQDNLVDVEDSGNPAIVFKLGVDFHFGRNGSKQSYKEAFQCFKILADQGSSDAQYNVGIYFKLGLSEIQQSFENAFTYFSMAANQGMPEAQYELGRLYAEGLGGLKKCYKTAFNYFKLAADQNYAPAQYWVGKRYRSQCTSEQAYAYIKLAADQGYSKAIYELGKRLQYGNGVEQDWDVAKKYFQLAAENGSKDAVQALVELEILIKEEKAASNGNLRAQIQLGLFYRTGKYVKKSVAKQCKYFKLAAAQGDPRAQYAVAECYRRGGLDFKASFDKALEYYKLAAANGQIEAIRFLAKHFFYSKFDPDVHEEGLKYLILGAQQEDPECQHDLASYYERGWGNLVPSLVNALRFYQLSAEQGHPAAQGRLKWLNRVLSPHAQKVDLQRYFENRCPATLKEILHSYGHASLFLDIEELALEWEEILVIRRAMIENPRFTCICSDRLGLPRLFLAFELIGYPERNLEHCKIIHPLKKVDAYGCVFIGHDLRDRHLNFSVEDPEKLRRSI